VKTCLNEVEIMSKFDEPTLTTHNLWPEPEGCALKNGVSTLM